MRDLYSPNMRNSAKKIFKRQIKKVATFPIDSLSKYNFSTMMPVFVVGCGHSGTTLISTIISRHSRAFPIGYESGLFLPPRSLRCARDILFSWSQLAKQYEKEFIVEKTPKHVHAIDSIFRFCSSAKVIFVVRDGRDVVCSLNKRLKDFRLSVERWTCDNKPAKKWEQDRKIFFIKYENITQNPTQFTGEICKFLDIEYESEMLESAYNPYEILSEGNMKLRSRQVAQKVKPNSGKWKHELTENEIEYFWKNECGLMDYFGYY